ncbi:MAG: phosphomannomutase/phosphoglucomutase [Pseudomonadota bacterium]
MIKRNKNSSTASKAPAGAEGVTVAGDALLGIALTALAIILITAAAAASYLHFVRAPDSRNALIASVSRAYATQQAASVANRVDLLGQEMQAAAASIFAANPPTADATAPEGARSQSRALLEQREGLLRAYFPQATSLKFIPLSELGTARLGSGEQGLRNLIEIDLVRRASNEETVYPEAYQHEGNWYLSLALAVSSLNNSDQKAVVLASFPEEFVKGLITYPQELGDARGGVPGAFRLQQKVVSGTVNREVTISTLGTGSGRVSQRSEVPNSNWIVEFEASAATVESFESHVHPDYAVIAVLTLAAVLAVVAAVLLARRAIQQQTEVILAGPQKSKSISLSIAALVPLAAALQKKAPEKSPLVDAQRDASDEVGRSVSSAAALASGKATASGMGSRELPANIFRAYDIRGVADTDLDDDTVQRIGSAIGTLARDLGETTLAVGCDGRNSSNRIKQTLTDSLLKSGCDVLDLGLVSTPLLYYATKQSEASSGVMVTGSHNPPDHNGFKIVLRGETVSDGTIAKIRDIASAGDFKTGKGTISQHDIASHYSDELLTDIAIAMPLRVVVDAGNGALSVLAPAVLEELGCEVIQLNCEIDGNFPNRSPDTSDERNLEALVQKVNESEADFGVAYDGDGDRVAVVSGSGRILRTDSLMMVFAEDVLSRNPGADVVYDVKCSRHLAQLVTSLGGRPVLWKTGHAFMKQKMLETGALFGGEFSGHIFFGERWYGFDDGLYATGRLAEIIASQEETLEELVAKMPQSVSTPEILLPVDDSEKFEVMKRFAEKAKFPDGKVTNIDGIRVDFGEGWGLLRASNTGPALTARFEAEDARALEHICTLFRSQLADTAPDLQIPF